MGPAPCEWACPKVTREGHVQTEAISEIDHETLVEVRVTEADVDEVHAHVKTSRRIT